MSAERQKNMRLQGRHAAPLKKTSPLSSVQRQSLSPVSMHDSSSSSVEFASPTLVYKKTNYVEEKKPMGPIVINDDENNYQRWVPISKSEKGVSRIYFDPHFLSHDKADELHASLLNSRIPWQEKEVVIKGEHYPQPRLVHWIGPFTYSYSSVCLPINNEWPDAVRQVCTEIENLPEIKDTKGTFNSVLLNLYRNEKDSVAWHSDNELSMGVKPLIASISLGETRRFEMKKKVLGLSYENKNASEEPEYHVHLEHGSLLIMDGALQDDWLHRVPKEYHSRNRRINLTFRTVYEILSEK